MIFPQTSIFMTTSEIRPITLSMGWDHLEELSKAVTNLTLEPLRDILYYAFPFTCSYFNNGYPLVVEPSLEAMMPKEPSMSILREIQDLTKCADLGRDIVPYITLNHTFSSSGGFFSLTTPALFIPEQHLFRKAGISSFTQEGAEENLKENLWVFSDDETRFLIARQVAQIKTSNKLIRLAVKVAVIAAIVTYQLPLFILAIGVHIISERFFEMNTDLKAIEILANRMENPTQVARQSLEKIRKQNLYKREHSTFGKWYITESGNNLLDLMHPLLTNRIATLQKQ